MSAERKRAKRPSKVPADAAETQLERIVRDFRDAGIDVVVVSDGSGGLEFVCQRGVILVRDAYLDQVAEVVGGGRVIESFVGLALYSLQVARVSDVYNALALIDAGLGAGVATPNHVLSPSLVGPHPVIEPEEVPAGAQPDPGVRGDGGRGILIYMADTGLLEGAAAHPWLAGATGDPDSLPPVHAGGATMIPYYAGHGTFAAGVARCMAPQAEIFAASDVGVGPAILEGTLIRRLDEALSQQAADVIVVPVGTRTRQGRPLLSFEALWEGWLRDNTNAVVVAAAGDDGQRGADWPARFPWAIAVGALDRDRSGRASFSNYGAGTDVYAPGTGLVNAFATGTYLSLVPPQVERRFSGLARWSGTSFAASVVAGRIATRMSGTGENARQAATSLLKVAQAQAIPGVGPALFYTDPVYTDPGGDLAVPIQGERLDDKLVFVVSSFAPEMEPSFAAIESAARSVGLRAERVKDVKGDYRITDKIFTMIRQARLIVADLTDERPNVYFELGYARGINKTVITILKEGTSAHFDVQDWTYLKYYDSRPLEHDLVERFKFELQRSETQET
jgi:hypothetical protein